MYESNSPTSAPRALFIFLLLKDKNRTFRTRLVAVWMLSNAGLAVAIESLNGVSSGNATKDEQALQAKQHTYFSLILWTTFGLSFVRFMGVRSLHRTW